MQSVGLGNVDVFFINMKVMNLIYTSYDYNCSSPQKEP
jgi:hypothetical protein